MLLYKLVIWNLIYRGTFRKPLCQSATAAFSWPYFILPWFSVDLGREQPPCSKADLTTLWTEWLCTGSARSEAQELWDPLSTSMVGRSQQAGKLPSSHTPSFPIPQQDEEENRKGEKEKGTHTPQTKKPKPRHDAEVITYNKQTNSQQASKQWLLSINYPCPSFTGELNITWHGIGPWPIQVSCSLPQPHAPCQPNTLQADQLLLCN